MIHTISSMAGNFTTSVDDRLKPDTGAYPQRQRYGQPQAREGVAADASARQSPAGRATIPGASEDGAATPATGQDTVQFSLTAEEIKELQQLKQRDREVKAHEQAHLAVAGAYARGGASYTFEKGPDGNRYAIGGEVPIDVSEGTSAEATIQKMRVIRRAALAPADPSPADRQIAANALAKEIEAKQQLAAENQSELNALLGSAAEGRSQRAIAGDASRPAADFSGSTRSMVLSAYQRISALY